ncbi:MAG: hypothetical protein JWM06_3395, partial [Actinomycetia bacterium]|nr:hypothetical protein [Actinomycetes bacterium]
MVDAVAAVGTVVQCDAACPLRSV